MTLCPTFVCTYMQLECIAFLIVSLPAFLLDVFIFLSSGRLLSKYMKMKVRCSLLLLYTADFVWYIHAVLIIWTQSFCTSMISSVICAEFYTFFLASKTDPTSCNTSKRRLGSPPFLHPYLLSLKERPFFKTLCLFRN